MSLKGFYERAQSARFQNDLDAMSDNSMIGEGGNKSAYFSPRGYVVKPVIYDYQSSNPFEQAEIVKEIDRFPRVEVDEMESDAPFQRAMVRMPMSDLSHDQAAELLHPSELIESDLNMFTELREEGITYKDFKPDNIGYFLNGGVLKSKPIDVFDGNAWEEQEELGYRGFAGIMETYIQGTEDEPGLADLYPISVIESERQVMDYFSLGEKHLDGDPYHDFMDAASENKMEFLE